MSEGFERREIQSRAEQPKEVKKVSDITFLKALFSFRELKAAGKSNEEAIETAASQFELDKTALSDWLQDEWPDDLGKKKTFQKPTPKPKRRFHSDEEIQRYQDSRPDLFA